MSSSSHFDFIQNFLATFGLIDISSFFSGIQRLAHHTTPQLVLALSNKA